MSEQALADHARDLPVMNGIREDIKGVMALEQGGSDHLEGLHALAIRLHSLQVSHKYYNHKFINSFLDSSDFRTRTSTTSCDFLFK